ncbi:hypothetical protein CPB84DRAFT_1813746 [Gymnopilus junonius]|uniref:Succinate dehydrogenase assembly factor 4, mitochondrial n=1 Tax=Gymnopilus junonius TaxID=109634 RepID=A0A9P5NRF9_GYMJU|nr:hypothetical protein CPB84DRAFT_1813746 [Gymnopilus junonius]
MSLFIRHVSLNRPAPLPLPIEDQREFEELQRKAQTTSAIDGLAVHPDAQQPSPEFDGDVNPITGEQGGPKREPIKRSTADPGGDWSFKGRVSDF